MKGLIDIKRNVSLVLSIAALLALTSCGYDSAVSRIRQNGIINVGYISCTTSQDAPFVIDQNTGLTAEPALKAAKALDVDLKLTRVTSNAAYDNLLGGSVDCLWNVVSPQKDIVPSVRTIETGIYYRQVVMTTDDSDISRLADVSGRTMAVVSGSDAETELHNAAVMESSLRGIKKCAGMGEVLEALTTGEADCAAVDEPQALYWTTESDSKFKFIDTPIAENQLVIATRLSDGELCSRIAETYVKMVQDGKIKDLYAKYTGSEKLGKSMQDNSQTV